MKFIELKKNDLPPTFNNQRFLKCTRKQFISLHNNQHMSELNLKDLEAELREAEDEINCKSRDVGRLKTEYTRNFNKIVDGYQPKTDPLTTAIFMSCEDQQALQIRIDWLEMKVVAMEQFKTNFFELRDMGAAKKALYDALLPRFQDSYISLEAVTKEELAVLRGYENPPQLVLDTFDTIQILRSEEDRSWENSKIMLSETYYYAFFVSKARSRHKAEITEEAMDALDRFLMHPNSVPEKVSLVSAPCGAIAKWLRVLRDFSFLETVTKPRTQTLDEAKEELLELRKRLQGKKDDVAGAQEKLALLEKEMSEQLHELRNRYDDTMIPMQQMFFDANQKFNDVYTSPRRQRDGDLSH